jgi:hypothetical protein
MSDTSCKGNGKNNERSPGLGAVAVFATILFSTTGLVLQRIGAAEHVWEKELAAVRSLIESHTALQGHPGVLAELASAKAMFVEVETQFQGSKDRQESADMAILQRLLGLEETDKERGSDWLSRIVRIEERNNVKQP